MSDEPRSLAVAITGASGAPSGTYFYRITAGNFTQVRQMLLVK